MQLGSGDRLGQDRIGHQLVLGRSAVQRAAVKGGNHQDRGHPVQRPGTGRLVQFVQQPQAVSFRQFPVEDQQREGIARPGFGHHPVQRIFGAGHRSAAEVPAFDIAGQHPLCVSMILHDQDMLLLQLLARLHAAIGDRLQRDDEPEGATLARYAVDPDLSAHGHGQLAADRKAQPAAAMRAGQGLVGLDKGLEQAVRLLLGQSGAGITHFKSDQVAPLVLPGPAGRNHHAALVGELDRIVDEVVQDLPDPQRVAPVMSAQAFAGFEHQLHPLAAGRDGEEFADLAKQVFDLHVFRNDFERVGVEPQEIQNVVQNAQQGPRRIVDAGKMAALRLVQRGLAQDFQHPQDRVHRRAQFVADIGQELVLGRIGAFRFDARSDQIGL